MLFAIGTAHAADHPAASAEADASKPFVVKIHPDWCGTCERTEETVVMLRDTTTGTPRIVVLDVTSRESVEQSRAEADRLGLRAFFDANKSKTGTIGILHGATREVVKILKGETELTAYLEALAIAAGQVEESS
jgi:hypothetical protein